MWTCEDASQATHFDRPAALALWAKSGSDRVSRAGRVTPRVPLPPPGVNGRPQRVLETDETSSRAPGCRTGSNEVGLRAGESIKPSEVATERSRLHILRPLLIPTDDHSMTKKAA